jgi:hypothetical protein
MTHLVIGIAALEIGLGIRAPAGATPSCDPEPVCHEFDWAEAYYDAFARHGISYLADREGIPLMEATDAMCRGQTSSLWTHFDRTTAKYKKIVEAAADVPGVLR